jgi:hypothetical protein
MLPVAHGWYSAIYKAFMALRLKPLVPLLKFVALILFLFVNCSSAVLNLGLSGVQIASQQTHLQQNNATASYVDEPLEQLLRIIPEMKILQPAQDQTQLTMILEHCGKNVDTQFKKFSDLAAKEIVSEIRVNPTTDLGTADDSPQRTQPAGGSIHVLHRARRHTSANADSRISSRSLRK